MPGPIGECGNAAVRSGRLAFPPADRPSPHPRHLFTLSEIFEEPLEVGPDIWDNLQKLERKFADARATKDSQLEHSLITEAMRRCTTSRGVLPKGFFIHVDHADGFWLKLEKDEAAKWPDLVKSPEGYGLLAGGLL